MKLFNLKIFHYSKHEDISKKTFHSNPKLTYSRQRVSSLTFKTLSIGTLEKKKKKNGQTAYSSEFPTVVNKIPFLLFPQNPLAVAQCNFARS